MAAESTVAPAECATASTGSSATPTPDQHHGASGRDTAARPAVVDRATWQAELDTLRVREKAHTREGDAIAAARRRLPMVEVDSSIPLLGPHGPVSLLEVFEGRRQLIAYFHTWHTGQPAEAQCEGCTFSNGQVRELSYLHSRDVTYATFCEDSYEESIRYRDFMRWDVPTAQWSRLAAGRSDDLGTGATATATAPHCCQNEPRRAGKQRADGRARAIASSLHPLKNTLRIVRQPSS